jgi:hypothetical protein
VGVGLGGLVPVTVARSKSCRVVRLMVARAL